MKIKIEKKTFTLEIDQNEMDKIVNALTFLWDKEIVNFDDTYQDEKEDWAYLINTIKVNRSY